MRFFVLFSVLACTSAAEAQTANAHTGVFMNRQELSTETLTGLKDRLGIQITPGRHWYDRMTGAWGYVGGPAAGFITPGLDLGGPLWRTASGGTTGIIVNGRELHWRDVVGLRSFGIPVRRGRYWLNAQGTGGYEGGPPLFNLATIARQRGQRPAIRRGGGQRQQSVLSSWDRTGVRVF